MKLNYADLINKPEKFTFFWETKSPFSQWHTCKFSACGQDFIKTGVQSKFLQAFPFTSAEQYMMFHKALAFHDFETCEAILKTSNVREQKLLGRSVKGYNETIWQEIRIQVVYAGNKEKFTQNKNLQDALFNSTGTTLVEAAPDDIIWGIGLVKEDSRALDRNTWLGKNLLGEILTQLRVDLMGHY